MNCKSMAGRSVLNRKGFPKTKETQGRISLQIEEQKIPPINDELVRQSATSVGMRGDAWLEACTGDDADVEPDDFLFRWDGLLPTTT